MTFEKLTNPRCFRRFPALVMLLCGVLAGVTACGSTQTAKVKPSLHVNSSPIDFGLVAVGETSSPHILVLETNTTAPVTLPMVSVTTTSGGGNVFAIKGMTPTEVLPRSMTQLSIVFTPAAATTYAGELVIKSNDADKPEVDILLTGQGASPQITVTPDHLGLTAVACPGSASSPRCQDSGTVTITNSGMVDLQLGTAGVYLGPATGETQVPANLTLANQVNTQKLLPGDSQKVTVVWKPAGNANAAQAEVGDFAATLVIKSNDPVHPEIDVPVAAHSDPAGPPTACANVLSVTQRTYIPSQQGGPPTVQNQGVNPMLWQDPMDPTTIHVRPGTTITLTSQRVKIDPMTGFPVEDTAAEQMNPCTADPYGDTITKAWALTAKPAESRSNVTPTMGTTTQLQIDAAGEYTVAFHVSNSLGLMSVPAVVNIDAQPRDDLFAQLTWQDGPGIDLDIHLLVDGGPGITTTASLFCVQDNFFFNPAPVWFSNSTGDEIPHLLRDDQGSMGQIESIDLVKAPPNSSFRLAAHYWDGTGKTTPQLTIRNQTTQYGPGGAGDTHPFTPPTPLQASGDAWFAVKVAFDANSMPTVTQLTTPIENDAFTADPDFTQPGSGVGACP